MRSAEKRTHRRTVSDSFTFDDVARGQRLPVFLVYFVGDFERRLGSDRPVEKNPLFTARWNLPGDHHDEWQGMPLLKDQELASKKIGFDIGLLHRLDPRAQFYRN